MGLNVLDDESSNRLAAGAYLAHSFLSTIVGLIVNLVDFFVNLGDARPAGAAAVELLHSTPRNGHPVADGQ
jgi:hypothetical protein